MGKVKTKIQNKWEDIKKDLKNATTDNPIKKIGNDLTAEGRKFGNTVRNSTDDKEDEFEEFVYDDDEFL